MTPANQVQVDSHILRAALRQVRQRAHVPFALGGPVRDGRLRILELAGARTNALRDTRVGPGIGLGGRVLATGTPLQVQDYVKATSITHDFDQAIVAERIRSMVAAPVVVNGAVRYVLYASSRDSSLGERTTDVLVDVARSVADELHFRAAVDKRVDQIVRNMPVGPQVALPTAVVEEVRELFVALRRLAGEVDDLDLRDRLRDAGDRLSQLGMAPREHGSGPALSARELDVLSEVALGCTNVEIGSRLFLAPGTVKAYLRSASIKLGARTRHEAVVAARRHGLLP